MNIGFVNMDTVFELYLQQILEKMSCKLWESIFSNNFITFIDWFTFFSGGRESTFCTQIFNNNFVCFFRILSHFFCRQRFILVAQSSNPLPKYTYDNILFPKTRDPVDTAFRLYNYFSNHQIIIIIVEIFLIYVCQLN